MSEILAQHEVALGADQPWRRPELKRHVEEAAGLRFTDEQWESLARGAAEAGRNFLWQRPHTPESRKRVEELRLAARRFRDALRAVVEAETRSVPDLRDAEAGLYGPLQAAASGRDWGLDPLDLLHHAADVAEAIHGAADVARKESRVGQRGAGKATTGYPDFLQACRDTWLAIMGPQAKGYSQTAGRGSGPFVRLAHAAEILLPAEMRRNDLAAVGDAIVRAFHK